MFTFHIHHQSVAEKSNSFRSQNIFSGIVGAEVKNVIKDNIIGNKFMTIGLQIGQTNGGKPKKPVHKLK